MSTLAAIAVQLQLTTRSVPPVMPVDLNTDQTPQVWRGEDWDIKLGIFDPAGVAVDLSNLSFLSVDLFPEQLPSQTDPTNLEYAPYSTLPFPSQPPAPILGVTIIAADITPTVSKEAWLLGQAQQAVASFGWIDTLSLNLGGVTARKFWMVVHGLTSAGRKITYGAGWITVNETGEQGIYLPNRIAPLVVPEFTILYVPPNEQLIFSQTIDVDGGLIEIEGMMVQV